MIYKIDSPDEYREFFEQNKPEFYSRLVESIQEAIESKKSKGYVCTIVTNKGRDLYDIDVFKEDWKETLDKCLEYFVENDYYDHAIDTYEVLQKVS